MLVISPDALLLQLADVTAAAATFWRAAALVAGVSVVVWIRSRGRSLAVVRSIGWAGSAAGLCFGAATILFVTAIDRTDAASVLATICAGPLFAAVIGRVLFGDAVARRTWIASGTVVLGVSVIVASSTTTRAAVGTLAALAASFAFAAFLTIVAHLGGRDPMPIVAWGGALAATVAASIALVWGDGVGVPASALWILVVLGAVIVPVAMLLLTGAATILPAPEVALISLLEVVLGPLWVWLALGERPSPTVVAAGACIVLTVGIHALVGWRVSGSRADAPGPIVVG